MLADDRHTNSVGDDLYLLLESVEVGFDEIGETVVSGDKDLLSTWELHL